MKSRVLVFVILGLFGTAVGSNHLLFACSCFPGADHRSGVLIPDNAVVPANAVGIPLFVWGYSAREISELKFDVQVRKMAGRKPSSIPVTLQPMDLTRFAGQTEHYDFFLIKPKGGLIPGTTYETSLYGFTWLIHVARERAISSQFEPRLAVETSSRSSLQTRTLGGSCVTTVDAQQLVVQMFLGRGAERWRAALLYFVRVDGVVWRPARALCKETIPGKDWFSPGSELLFTVCSPPDGDRPSEALPSGQRLVEFVAWLPGTDLIVTAEQEITLECEQVHETTSGDH